ncbi:MAG: hypothetical protein ACFFCZ_29300 [Promethearchaeota archaeon]
MPKIALERLADRSGSTIRLTPHSFDHVLGRSGYIGGGTGGFKNEVIEELLPGRDLLRVDGQCSQVIYWGYFFSSLASIIQSRFTYHLLYPLKARGKNSTRESTKNLISRRN